MMVSSTIIAGVLGNILSVVGIVITNKYLTEKDGYQYMVFLSFLHFCFTTLGTRILLSLNVFTYKPANTQSVFIVALGSLLSVAVSYSIFVDIILFPILNKGVETN